MQTWKPFVRDSGRQSDSVQTRIGRFRVAAVAATLWLGGVIFGAAQTPTQVVTRIPWAGHGVWLKADFHTQTRFTDGAHTVDEVVAAAVRNSCDAVAITDHADGNLKGGTPEYVEAIRKARADNPNMTVLTAMEWNVPPGKGQEHATILFPPQMESSDVLMAFKDRFDDERKSGETAELAVNALAALTPTDQKQSAPVVFFNHPSRRPASTSAPALTFEPLEKLAPALLVGLEGAPGHQRATPLGAYPTEHSLNERWDPIAADVDGLWDQWLRKGLNVWMAIANSDFHNESDDFWPCEFAATWVYAPDRSIDGILRAMRAGSFFAEHGHIASEVELEARLDGQSTPVTAGETVATTAGTHVTVSLNMTVPATDYAGRANRIDIVELIGVSRDKSEILFSGAPGTNEAFKTTITVPAGGIVLRSRGRRDMSGEPALMFYTNPIRIVTR